MIYAVNKRTKEHRVAAPGSRWKSPWTLVEATPDGWIEWQGGECPLPDGAKCEYRMRDGDEDTAMVFALRWTRWGDDSDIIAYRPILSADTKPESPAWDGEGLPPVGCECELAVSVMASFDDLESMREVSEGARVFISGRADFGYGEAAVYGGFLDGIWFYGIHKAAAFRPIRSEKDRAVDEMARDIRSNAGDSLFDDEPIMLAEALYRAGYRKENT